MELFHGDQIDHTQVLICVLFHSEDHKSHHASGIMANCARFPGTNWSMWGLVPGNMDGSLIGKREGHLEAPWKDHI